MWKIVTCATVQSLLLVAAQTSLKFALLRMAPFGWNRRFWLSVLTNWQFALSGALFAACSHESVGPSKWLGVALIIAGCLLISK